MLPLGILLVSAAVAAPGPAVVPGPAVASPAARLAPEAQSPPAAVMASLGRLMFFDPTLSASGKLACGTCHDPRYAYGPPPGKALAIGGKDMAQTATRAVPSLRYLHGAPAFSEQHRFLDGDVGPVGGGADLVRCGPGHQEAAVPAGGDRGTDGRQGLGQALGPG